ncbi:MAG: FtsX-like permease family protein [Promethearchaeota archaeon]|nr:MAG: FtsX-like permease family protein [Candidatus Lokiarchaeota archaeon]
MSIIRKLKCNDSIWLRRRVTINKKLEFKIAYRTIMKHPIRTFFTLLSIVLGVAIFFSVNIAIDSLEQSLYANINESDLGDADIYVQLFRGVLMVLSAISLIICIIIIKNLMEMSRENQMYEIGLLRTLGLTKSSIFLIFILQIFMIAIIGMLFGLIVGFFLSQTFFGPLKSMLDSFLSLQTDYEVSLFISPFTYFSSITAGLIIPLIFGTIPSLKASKVDIVSALRPYLRTRNTKIRNVSISAFKVILSLLLIISGLLLMNYSYSGLIDFGNEPTMETNLSIVFLFISGLIFIVGSVILGGTLLPYLSKVFSFILAPFLLKLHKISERNIKRNLRRSRNTFSIISMSLALLIMISIVFSSVQAGVLPGARMRIGGDIRLALPFDMDQNYIPLTTSQDIKKISGVEEVCEVKTNWRSDNLCDSFGNHSNENFFLYVINTTSYVNIHSSNSIYEYEGDKGFNEFIHQLDENRTIILQSNLANRINKNLGSQVNIQIQPIWPRFPYINNNLSIVGLMSRLPGVYHSYLEGNEQDIEYSGVISWNTYFNLTGENPSITTSGFWIKCNNPFQADTVKGEIENLYQSLGSPWNTTLPWSEWNYRDINIEITLINDLINLILTIVMSILYMALIISVFGTIISMIMNIRQRSSEIGVLRAIGTSKLKILLIISGEILIIGIIAILVGIITGSIAGNWLTNVPFIAYIPFIFTINWIEIIIICSIMLSLTLIGSLVPGIIATRLDVIENIRKRGI